MHSVIYNLKISSDEYADYSKENAYQQKKIVVIIYNNVDSMR